MPTIGKFHGYDEARKIDEKINRLFRKEPPTKENFSEWMSFSRTLRTTLNIIDMAIKDARVKAREETR